MLFQRVVENGPWIIPRHGCVVSCFWGKLQMSYKKHTLIIKNDVLEAWGYVDRVPGCRFVNRQKGVDVR